MGYKTFFEQIKTICAWNSLNTNKQHLDFSMLACYRNLYQEKWADNEIIYEYCLLYQQVDY